MSQIKNARFLSALAREPVDATPIWIMRQAGRYLPEYRAIRSKIPDFMTLCKTPELACEVTLQPLKRFDLDAAILFSDILTIPDAMGLGLRFVKNEGPIFDNPIRSEQDIERIRMPDMKGDLGYVTEAIKLITKELDGKIPLIGFAGSPWTLATYMLEGESSKNFQVARKLLYSQPRVLNLLLEKLTLSVSQYLQAQIAAGVQAVMLFDTWGGLLTQATYKEFSLKPMTNIIKQVRQTYPDIPFIIFTKGGGLWLSDMIESGADGLGVDWTICLQEARARVNDQVALQGNMDPAVLYGNSQTIRQEVQRILLSYGQGPGHIFNLGHGIYPDMDVDHVRVLIDSVHELSQTLNLATV